MTHSELVARAVRWLSRRCSVVFSEFVTSHEVPDAIGWNAGCSTLIECKVSRADFLADRKKPHRRSLHSMGLERYYMVPDGLIRVDDLPPKWGLLYVRNRHVRVIRKSDGFPERATIWEIRFLTSMLRRVQVRLGSHPLSDWLRFETLGKPDREAVA